MVTAMTSEQFEVQLRAECERQGEDFDTLVKRASKHFTNSRPTLSTSDLSAEIEMLIEDDERDLYGVSGEMADAPVLGTGVLEA